MEQMKRNGRRVTEWGLLHDYTVVLVVAAADF